MAQCGELRLVVYDVGRIKLGHDVAREGVSQLGQAHGGELAGLAVSIGLQLPRLVVDALQLSVCGLLLLLLWSLDEDWWLLLSHVRRGLVLSHEATLPSLHVVRGAPLDHLILGERD